MNRMMLRITLSLACLAAALPAGPYYLELGPGTAERQRLLKLR